MKAVVVCEACSEIHRLQAMVLISIGKIGDNWRVTAYGMDNIPANVLTKMLTDLIAQKVRQGGNSNQTATG